MTKLRNVNARYLVIAFLIFAAAERVYARRFSRQAARGQVKMTWTLAVLDVLHATIYVGTAVECLLARTATFGPLMALGLAVYAISLVLRHAAIRTLGRYWSLQLEIRDSHELVRTGPYRYVRHPAYLAIILEVIAIPLVGRAYYTLLVSLGAYIPVLLLRWAGEEREMVKKLGEQYASYQREVPAFFPRLWNVRRGSVSDRTA